MTVHLSLRNSRAAIREVPQVLRSFGASLATPSCVELRGHDPSDLRKYLSTDTWIRPSSQPIMRLNDVLPASELAISVAFVAARASSLRRRQSQADSFRHVASRNQRNAGAACR